uniref:Uncharacterized protein n=1 Tax=Vespula pensylvanica TaxID=30213 RepID=A0A834PEZ9_VESPE|nr:hypothetical protein H0235_000900 [Vespula pensylvanica]
MQQPPYGRTRESDTKSTDVQVNETKSSMTKWSHKNLALKILSLKVAAHLKWNLDILEKKLPLPIQVTLLQDLFYITTDTIVEISAIPDFSIYNVSDQALFTIVLYHR